ncbi:hypothetical protein ACQCLI_18355 [Pseudomonas nitroreducens]|uniref:hypothetical protein n=1 Tax=Pseudomonas nitroreducens TaxID=46680 RepID=UPI00037857D0|nr:hypothetical protein [Pseudomonas nitroreducens]
MPDYKAAFEAASLDLSTIMSALGFVSYPGIDPMLRAITNLTLAKAEAQALREQLEALRAMVVVFPDFDNDVIIDTFRRNGFRIELGETYSVKGQIAQLLNALGELARLNGKAVSEGLLRRIVEEQPAMQDIGEMFNWQYARDQAMAELRALLGEVNEHE